MVNLIIAVIVAYVMYLMLFIINCYRIYEKLKHDNPIRELLLNRANKEDYCKLQDIDVSLRVAVIGTEDKEFFNHRGVVINSVIVALIKRIFLNSSAGGSCITQQLAKNLYLDNEKTFNRKLIELFLSLYIERELNKEEILELYLNIVEYGPYQYGLKWACDFYFHKKPKDLTVNESITLALVLPAPRKFSPHSKFGMFTKGKQRAMNSLMKWGFVDAEDKDCILKLKFNDVLNDALEKKYRERFTAYYYYKLESKLNKLTGMGLVIYAKKYLNVSTVYLWGGLGYKITENIISDLKKLYPKKYNDKYCSHLLECGKNGCIGFDCSGLIKSYLMGGSFKFRYNSELDYNSEMLLNKSSKKGAMSILPEISGVCLYMPGHVGIYAGNGLVIEATNNPMFGDGVVCTDVRDREWQRWFFCPNVDYIE